MARRLLSFEPMTFGRALLFFSILSSFTSLMYAWSAEDDAVAMHETR
jgi:hypothetical protein